MTTERLLGNVRVNAIADYYDVPQLKQLANEKIEGILETSWTAQGFSTIIKEAFKSTSDKELYNIIALAAASHIEELVELEDFAALEVIGDFAISIMRKTTVTHKVQEGLLTERLKTAESYLQSIERDYTHEKTLREREATRAHRAIKSIDDCLDTLRDTGACRNTNCDALFTCYVERSGSRDEPSYLLRCAKCRCKHRGAE